jgi:hypothetical protein
MSNSKNLRAAALLVPLALAGLSGCGGARYIVQDQYGGVVAIPSNTNYWPVYYRDEAEKLMKQKCPQGYHIDREEEVVVGQTTTGSDNTDTRSYDLPGGKKQPSGALTTTTASHSTTTHDKTEYRITFHANPPVRVEKAARVTVPMPTQAEAPKPTPPGLPREPIPVAN